MEISKRSYERNSRGNKFEEMKNFLLKYSSKISVGLLITIILSYTFGIMTFKMWGIYLILNALLCLGLFIVNGNPIWLGYGSSNYVMEKLLNKGYNRYVNLTISIMSFVLGYGILTF